MVELIPLVGHRHRVNDLPVGREPGFTSITASASGFEKSGLSSKVYAKFSGRASIASFGDAWKVGSGLIVIVMPSYWYQESEPTYVDIACRRDTLESLLKLRASPPRIGYRGQVL